LPGRVEGDVKSTDQIGGNLNLRVERIASRT
jgi:translocation and assembly module TamB